MFKVRATLKTFLGDEEKYPCHMEHSVGDEIVFDGERYLGRLCPDIWPLLTPKVAALYQAGPRYVEPPSHYPFWYAPPSVRDPLKKVYDALGYKPVLNTLIESKYHMANLAPLNAFKWPPHSERTVMKEVSVVCPDLRTAALFVLEAFDLSDKGFAIPFFRRQVTILDRVSKNQGIEEQAILEHFSADERREIYPPLVHEILLPLDDELVLMSYLERREGKVFVTEKGKAKLREFRETLTKKEWQALRL
ncbi:MAG: hypothetical protein ABSD38_03865 [Syntrophorhabdales bacterium]|jgi:uncharacterized repeat protein (TIGR04076 family)